MSHNPFESLELKLTALQLQVNKLAYLLDRSLQQPSQDEIKNANGINLAVQITGLAKGTVYNLVSERKIPHYKRGKRIYFDSQELHNWIKEGRRLTKDELKRIHEP